MLYQSKNPHGGDIYGGDIQLDFSANINPLGTPPAILTAMERALAQVCHYPDPYCRELVGAIAAFEGVDREHILCGNGAAELIYAYCAAARPRRAVLLAPTFAEYALGLEQAGCQMATYPLRQDNDFDLDRGFLPYLEAQRPDAVFLCSPNNPTGRLIPPALLEEVLLLCHQLGARLFLDECFLDLTEDGVSMKGLVSEYKELFILKAFTKSYAMAGVRLGYCLCSDGALLGRMAAATQPWNVSVLAQAAGVAALGEEAFLARSRALIAGERRWLQEKLEALGLWVCPGQANYLLLRGPEGLCPALRQLGIAIRDCGNYRGLGPGWYRVAVRQREENRRLIAALEQICGKESQWQSVL